MKQNILKFHFYDNNTNLFLTSRKNIFAFKTINEWPNWKNNFIFIYGPKNCGKTHILELWRNRCNAGIIDYRFFDDRLFSENLNKLEKNKCWVLDNIDKIFKYDSKDIQVKFLNILNILTNSKCFLLITSRTSPTEYNFSLDDLSSRLNSILVIEVKEPDEDLLKDIILKKLKLRQVVISEKNLEFLVKRMERTYNEAIRISELIDKRSLESHSKVSFSLLKDILKENNS